MHFLESGLIITPLQPYNITVKLQHMTNNEKYFGGFEQISKNGITKYALQYFFGTWVTSAWLYAETDAEAIFDARDEMKAPGKLRYRLMKGRELVKNF